MARRALRCVLVGLAGGLLLGGGCSDPVNDLHSEKAEERITAIRALAREGTESAVEDIVPVVSHPDEATALEAVRGVGRIPKERASAALVQVAVNDERPAVRVEAAVQLGYRRDPRAAATLRNLVEKDPAPQVRAAAATSLGHMGDLTDVNRLLRIAETDPDPSVQSRAVGAIEEMLSLRFEFNPWASPEEREKAMRRVRTVAPRAAEAYMEFYAAQKKESRR